MVLLNGLFDVLDGAVAKVRNMQSKRGDMVDHVLDRYADVLILLGLSFNCNVYLALVAIATVLLISYLGVESQALLSKRDYGGLLGRADRLVLLIIIPVVQGSLGPCWMELNWNLIDLLMIYFIVVGTITVLQRSHRLWKELGDFRQQK
jgi:archaetidylinositol phosphate synthase